VTRPLKGNRIWVGKGFESILKPGETMKGKDRLFISKWFDVRKPGNYTILVQRFDDASRQIVKAEPVTVTVTE